MSDTTPTPLSQDAKAREMARELHECCSNSHREWIGGKLRLPDGHSCMDSRAASALLSAHARMEGMEKALRPFAAAADAVDRGDKVDMLRMLTIGHMRAAQKALSPASEVEDP